MAARQPAAQAANGAAVSAQRMNGTSRIGLAVLTAGVLLVDGVKLDHTPPDLHRDDRTLSFAPPRAGLFSIGIA